MTDRCSQAAADSFCLRRTRPNSNCESNRRASCRAFPDIRYAAVHWAHGECIATVLFARKAVFPDIRRDERANASRSPTVGLCFLVAAPVHAQAARSILP